MEELALCWDIPMLSHACFNTKIIFFVRICSTNSEFTQNLTLALRALSLYFLFDESSDKIKLARQLKKLAFELFFFLRHYQKEEIFFTNSVVILLKIGICWNYFYFPDMSQQAIFFYPPTPPQNPCRDPSNREYSESALITREVYSIKLTPCKTL